MRRDLLIALSLANLCFLRSWNQLLNGKVTYYAQVPPTSQLAADALNVLLLALIFWTGAQLVRRSPSRVLVRLARWAFLLVVLANLRVIYLLVVPWGRWGWVAVVAGLLLLAAGLYLLARWEVQAARVVAVLLLILSPFAVVTLYQDAVLALRVRRMSFADQPAAATLPVKPGAPRVVWIIFDELDQRLTFDQRPASVRMPEFVRLRAQSLSAAHAFAPARTTEIAMPALISGRLISKAEPRGASELMVTYGDSVPPVPWSGQPNVFSRARELGFNTALVGWYLPYCRVLASNLSACSWYDGPLLRGGLRLQASIGEAMKQQAASILITTLGPDWVNRAEREEDIRDYLAVLTEGQRRAADPGVGLILVHLPVPHPAGIWDRARHEFKTTGESSYLDNLELADHALGELRQTMERAGVWDASTVVISGDHWWRTELWDRYSVTEEEAAVMPPAPDHRVPFIVKLAGQNAPLAYQPEMNTVLTHDLLLALLRGELRTPQEVAAWLDRNRSLGDSPYNVLSRDSRTAFVDGVSAERREPRNSIGLSCVNPQVFEAAWRAHIGMVRPKLIEGTRRRLDHLRRRRCA